jgi:hypothetical protein
MERHTGSYPQIGTEYDRQREEEHKQQPQLPNSRKALRRTKRTQTAVTEHQMRNEEETTKKRTQPYTPRDTKTNGKDRT